MQAIGNVSDVIIADLNRRKQLLQITLKFRDNEVTDVKAVVNQFNNYFFAVGSGLAKIADNCSPNFVDFLGDRN